MEAHLSKRQGEWKHKGEHYVYRLGLYRAYVVDTSEDIGVDSSIMFDGLELLHSHGAWPTFFVEGFIAQHAAIIKADRHVPWFYQDPSDWGFGFEHMGATNGGAWWEVVGPCKAWSWARDGSGELYTHRKIVPCTTPDDAIKLLRKDATKKLPKNLRAATDNGLSHAAFASNKHRATHPVFIRAAADALKTCHGVTERFLWQDGKMKRWKTKVLP
jgi:hypothetical protein